MQVTNNNYSTSFGMLKMSREAQRYLTVRKNDPEIAKLAETLKGISEELKDMKKCHMLIEGDLSATIETPANRYSGYFIISKPRENLSEFVNIRTIYTGKNHTNLRRGADYTATYLAPTSDKAAEVYKKQTLPYYQRVAEITKFIDSVI